MDWSAKEFEFDETSTSYTAFLWQIVPMLLALEKFSFLESRIDGSKVERTFRTFFL